MYHLVQGKENEDQRKISLFVCNSHLNFMQAYDPPMKVQYVKIGTFKID